MAVANITQILEERPIGAFQKGIVALCAAIVFVDGFNAQLSGYIVPALVEAWKITPADRTWFIFTGLAGLALGGLFIAPLADKFGRKPVVIACVTLFGLCSVVSAAAPTMEALDIGRFLTGLGLGGVMPNAISLTAEYSPNRSRHVMVTLMMSGFIGGAVLVGLVSASLVNLWGWQSVLVVGGVMSLVLAAILAVWLPESIRFMVLHGGARDVTIRLLQRIDPSISLGADTRMVMADESKGGVSVSALFRKGRAMMTVLVWIIYFMSLLNLYLMASWLPTHVRSLGISVELSILIATMLQVGGLGGVSLGFMLDRAGASATIFTAYFIGAISIATIALVGSNVVILTIAVTGAGFGIIGGQNAINAFASGIYPTHIRSTGVGWATGIGRIGSIVGPTVAGILLQMHVSSQHIFFLAVIPALIGSAAGIGLGASRALAAKAA